MNLATVTKQQTATRFNNQDKTPLAFAAQRASLTPHADTVSFSSHAQAQPKFSGNLGLKGLLFLLGMGTFASSCQPDQEPINPTIPTVRTVDWHNRPAQFENLRMDTVASSALLENGFDVIHTATPNLEAVDYPIMGSTDFENTMVALHEKMGLSAEQIAQLRPFYDPDSDSFAAASNAFQGPPAVKSQLMAFYFGGITNNQADIDLLTRRVIAGNLKVYPDNWDDLPPNLASRASALRNGTAYASNFQLGDIDYNIWNYTGKGFGETDPRRAGVIARNEMFQSETDGGDDNKWAEIGGWLMNVYDMVKLQPKLGLDLMNVTDVAEEQRNIVAVNAGNGEYSPPETFIYANGAKEFPETLDGSNILSLGKAIYRNAVDVDNREITPSEIDAFTQRGFTRPNGQPLQVGDEFDESTINHWASQIANLPMTLSENGDSYYDKLILGDDED